MSVVLLAAAAAGLMVAPACRPAMARATLHMNADQNVMRWCQETNRNEASLTVSQARNTVEALRDFWFLVRSVGLTEGAAQHVIAFDGWSDAFTASEFSKFVKHINLCSECSDMLGESLLCAARHPSNPQDGEPASPYPLFVLKKFAKGSSGFSADDDEYFGGFDPFADLEARLGGSSVVQPKNSGTDDQVLSLTRKWVEAVIVEMKVCPFSASADFAGLPMGGVQYPINRATTADEVYQVFYEELERLLLVDEREHATTLLVLPDFSTLRRAQNRRGTLASVPCRELEGGSFFFRERDPNQRERAPPLFLAVKLAAFEGFPPAAPGVNLQSASTSLPRESSPPPPLLPLCTKSPCLSRAVPMPLTSSPTR